MAKQFIKITQTYAPSNKVKKLCLEEIQKIDCTLCDSIEQVDKLINEAYELAISNYMGTAARPALRSYNGSLFSKSYYVESVIHLAVYEVKHELK